MDPGALLSSALLALAMLAQPETLAGRIQLERVARVIIPVARKHGLDPTLIAAIAIAESGGRNSVAFRRGRGRAGADVGVFQIHCPRARASCVKRYQDLEASATEAAQILLAGKRLCAAPRPAYRAMCQRGFWARYNPASPKWAVRVSDLWTRIRAHMLLPPVV